MRYIPLPRPIHLNPCPMVVVYGEDRKEIFRRGFEDGVMAYLFLKGYWNAHPTHYCELYLNGWNLIELEKRRRMWNKRCGFN